jgi:CMP-N,N'-diacetyllegionaminic acid synthase
MIVALIPARGGSKRIHKKNLVTLGGVPLVVHTILAAKAALKIDHVVVSSDSHEILAHAMNNGVVDWKRSPEASTDSATDRDVIMDFLNGLESVPDSAYGDIDMIVYLRPTTPLRRIYDIDSAIDRILDLPDATGLRSVHEMSESAYKCFEVEPSGRLRMLPFSDRFVRCDEIDMANLPNQLYPKTYHPNGVVDIIRPEVVLTGATYGKRVVAHVTSPVIEIDTPFDLKMAEIQHGYRSGGRRIIFK